MIRHVIALTVIVMFSTFLTALLAEEPVKPDTKITPSTTTFSPPPAPTIPLAPDDSSAIGSMYTTYERAKAEFYRTAHALEQANTVLSGKYGCAGCVVREGSAGKYELVRQPTPQPQPQPTAPSKP